MDDPKPPEPLEGTLHAPLQEPTLQAPSSSPPAPRPEAPLPPEAAEAAKNPANVQGKYVRVKRVGAGGMGEVWRAWDRALGRWVALKFMLHDDEREVARFRREAQTAAKLSHPNIAAIYEAEDAFIAMQFVHGQTLATFPRDDRRALIGLLRDAAQALQYAHEQGVVHRDIKPPNLMVEGKGSARRLYVMDFGLAKETQGDSALSVTGNILGTPAYMPPEQARGRIGEIDARSDVYSLGATLYELLTDRPLFPSKDVYELLKKVVEEDPKPLRQINRRIEADLETIVLKCLEKDPGRRYPSMQEVADDLGRWLQGEPILAHPPSTAYRVRKYLARRKGLVAAVAGTAVIALAAWGVVGTVARGREFDRLKAEAERAFSEKRWLDARTAGVRALEFREEPALAGLAREADARAKAEEADKQERIAEGETFRRLQDRLKPVESLINETRPFFYIESIDIRAKLDQVERALPEIEALARAPEHAAYAEPWLLLGMGRYFAGDAGRAAEALARAASLKPDDGRIHFYLAKVFVEQGDLAYLLATLGEDDALGDARPRADAFMRRAAEHARRAAAGWVGAEEVDRHLAACYDALARKDAPTLEALCAEGQKRFGGALGSEEFTRLLGSGLSRRTAAQCVELLSQSLKRRPQYDVALYERATWHYIAKDPAASIADFRKALVINPRLTYARLGLATALDQTGEFEEALREADRFVEALPELVEGYVLRALVRTKLRDYAGAVADCDRALGLNPKSWRSLVMRGQSRRAMRELDAAIADYTAALALQPGAGVVHSARAQAWLQKGVNRRAIEDYSEGLRLGDLKVENYINRSLVYTRLGEHDAALKDADDAVRIAPEMPKAAVRLATARLERDDVDGAIRELTRVLAKVPGDAEALAIRGRAYMFKENWDAALKDLEEALRKSPNAGFRQAIQEYVDEARKAKEKK